MNINDFTTDKKPTWCPGCGNFGILNAIKLAFVKLGLKPEDMAIAFGIGCSGNMSNLIKAYGIHTLHGRSVAVAEGIKLANRDLNVFVIAGDGDSFGIGGNHFMQVARRNIDITMIVLDNHRYSLTTGQTSPTTDKGDITNTSLYGSIEDPFNPIAMGLAADATFIARGYAGMLPEKLADLIVKATKHRGFSLVDILQPCVTFNDLNTFAWYQKRIYNLQDRGYKPTDKVKAFAKAQEWGDKIPIGVFYEEKRPTYEDQQPQIASKEVVEKDLSITNLGQLMDEFV